MNIEKYLSRINFSGKPSAKFESLKNLHRQHLYHIPFENLNIHYKKQIKLEPDYLFDKIVEENRGGFCYELNGLFYLLLKEIGFNADMVSARVKRKAGGYGEEFDHLAIIVHLEEDWLADVGFGDSFIEPIKFKIDEEQKENNRVFKIIKHDNEYFRLLRREKEDFEDQYIFSLLPRSLNEFENMCVFHQTSPDSSFTQKRICTLATDDGRITLSELNLIIRKNGIRKEILLSSEKEFREKLLEYFKISLDS